MFPFSSKKWIQTAFANGLHIVSNRVVPELKKYCFSSEKVTLWMFMWVKFGKIYLRYLWFFAFSFISMECLIEEKKRLQRISYWDLIVNAIGWRNLYMFNVQCTNAMCTNCFFFGKMFSFGSWVQWFKIVS